MSDIPSIGNNKRTKGFQPGKSGNPNGRPKTPQEVKDAFRAMTPLAIKTLKEVMEDTEGKASDRVRAAEVSLNRAWGTPEQSVNMNGAIVTIPVDTSKLSNTQQDALIDALSTVLAQTTGQDESQATD